MQPFALTVEGDHDTISDELAGALATVFDGDTADQHSADVAHALAGAAVDLIRSDGLGGGVERYTVSVIGRQTTGAGHDGLDTIGVSVSVVTRQITAPAGGGEPTAQV